MKFIDLAVSRPVTTLVFYASLAVLGFVSFRELSIDLLPDIRYPRLSVITHYPDAAPQDMETLVTAPLEAAFSGIPDLSRMESISREGVSFLTLEFPWGTDMEFARLHAREKIDGVHNDLPEGVRGPLISSLDPGETPIMILAVSGDQSLLGLKELAEELIKPRLEQAQGVASADIAGGIEREIQVEVDPVRLAEFHMTLEDVAAAVESFNCDLQGVSLRKGQARHSLRISGEFEDVSQIGGTPLRAGAGSRVVRLRDVAVIRDSIRERLGMTRLNGQESIGMMVRKEPGANTVEATKYAKREINGILAENPRLSIQVVSEQSGTIEAAVAAAKEEIAGGALLAFLVLLLFLQEIRTPVIIGIVMPMSILATFNLLFSLDVTLNIMSLGGLALGVGMLDDCAVVVSENIFRLRRLGAGPVEAAVLGAEEVGSAVTGTALTTVVVFLPVIYVRGPAGQLFRDAALTVTCSLLASLIVSLTLLPMLASRRFAAQPRNMGAPDYPGPGLPVKPGIREPLPDRIFPPLAVRQALTLAFKNILRLPAAAARAGVRFLVRLLGILLRTAGRALRAAGREFDSGYEKLVAAYLRGLAWSLDHKRRVILSSALFFGLTALIATGIDHELLPRMETASFELHLKVFADHALEQTSNVVASIEDGLGRMRGRGVQLFFSQIGVVSGMEALNPETSLDSARIHVEAAGPGDVEEILDDLRRHLNGLPEVRYSIVRGQSIFKEFLAFGGQDIDFRVRGSDLRKLQEIAFRLASEIADIPGVVDALADFGEGKPEVTATVKSEALAADPGLSVERIGAFFASGVRGKIATRLREMEKKTDVRVRFAPDAASDFENLLNIYFPIHGIFVPLRSLVGYEISRGPREIRRVDQRREIPVTANLSGLGLSRALTEINERIRRIPLPGDCRIVPGGEQEEMRRSFRGLIFAFVLAVLLNYMIMAAQFESLRLPLLILSTIPMGFSGSIWIMWATGQTLNIISIIGMIVLLGIIVDNAIVKIDCTNRLRRQGASLRRAIIEGSHARLRPILMSTLTTLAGLVPMSLGMGRGSDILRPLGIVVVGGLAFSTFLTLFLIPVIYEAMEAGKRGSRDAIVFRGSREPDSEP